MRPHYGWASHRVHAGAKGAALNVLHRGPFSAMLAGPTNWGLADPGHGTLVSLYQITTSLLLFGRSGLEDEPMRITILRALEKLVDEAGEAFLKVHKQRGDLVDEYFLTVYPLMLGGGKRLFRDDRQLRRLELVDSMTTSTGGVVLTYRPAR
jgi:hypothetical protein